MNDTEDCTPHILELAIAALERLLLSMEQMIQLAMTSSFHKMSEDMELMHSYVTLRTCIKELSCSGTARRTPPYSSLGGVVIFVAAVRSASESMRVEISLCPSRAVVGLTRPRSYVVQALAELRRLSASSRTPQDPVGL